MNKEQKYMIIKLISATLLLTAAYFIPITAVKNYVILVSYFVIGYNVIISSIKNILKGEILDEEFLMTVATIAAFVIGEYFEATAVMLFYNLGELFQDIAVDKSRKSISELMNIYPDYANLITENSEKRVSPEELNKNDVIIVKPGEKIPADGEVIEGITSVDTSMLTGESIPQELICGDFAASGTVNISSPIKIRVLHAAKESTAAKILNLVERASEKKSKSENFITKFSKIYTPAVVICAILISLLPAIILKDFSALWLRRGIIFLVVSCPCALVVSVPLSFFCSIGSASKRGALIKGSNYVEALSKVNVIAFDKTGTLTKGNLNVASVSSTEMSKNELIEIAAFSEAYSNHPASIAIRNEYEKEIDLTRIKEVKEMPGYGVSSEIDGKKYYIGNEKLMLKILQNPVEHIEGTVVYICNEAKYLGHILLNDEIKENSKDAIKTLRKLGVKSINIITGDSKTKGEEIGNLLGIDKVYASLLPQEKLSVAENLINKCKAGKTFVYVGDGVNDAPVLARADVGIAMGKIGSDAAIEASDAVILNDDPMLVADVIALSKKTAKVVKENVALILFIKFTVLILSSFGFTDITSAVFADVGTLIISVLNSLRCSMKVTQHR